MIRPAAACWGAGGFDPVIRRSLSGGVMAVKSGFLPLWQELTLVLVVKIALIATIWAVWFSDHENHKVDEQVMASRIFPSTNQKEPEHAAIPGTR
jgi:hypothetical protein